MKGKKIIAGLGLAGILMTSFNTAGADDGHELKTPEQFKSESAALLKKRGYKPGAVMEYDQFDTYGVAYIKHGVSKDGKKGAAHVACSRNIVLEVGMNCKIGSVLWMPER